MKKLNKENEKKIAYYEEVTGKKWDKNATELYCFYKHLTVLPALPPKLTALYCYNNGNLEVLPELPNNLKILYCYNNRLKVLPKLPSGLKILYCYNNQLSILPKLPYNLKIINCSYNNLEVLPTLPRLLKNIDYSYNPLKIYVEIKGDENYKYRSKGFIAGGKKYVQMGCRLRLLSEWEKNFWDNNEEFPNNGSEKSNNRYKRFLKIKNYLDKF